jgi:cyclophilin family peptidyl-prolyl cis-trans isomerase
MRLTCRALRRAVPALITALALAVAGCGDDEEETPEAGVGGTTVQATTPAEEPATTTPGGCEQVEPPSAQEPTEEPRKPKQPLDPGKEWSLVVKTNCGDFTVALDLDSGPNAAASLVSLARIGYFDNTVFHRIVPGFVIQGGDPTASGSGGPGYKTVDRPPRDARYTKGVVAMAKTQTEPAGTAGSQFYVVTGADAGLPPDYAVVGEVTEGLDVVEKIGELGDPATEQPTEPVVISTVEVVEQ